MKNGDVPLFFVCLPEGTLWDYGIQWYDSMIFFIGFHGLIFHDFPSDNFLQFANLKMAQSK